MLVATKSWPIMILLTALMQAPANGAASLTPEVRSKDMKKIKQRGAILFLLLGFCLHGMPGLAADQAPEENVKKNVKNEPMLTLMGNRFLTFNTVVRVRQIEVTRDVAHGPDESSVHTSAEARTFREAIETAWPGARITWAFSWLALHDERVQYRELRDLKTNAPAQVIDFTRYDLSASEPADPEPGKQSRNWSLMNRLNQKGVRPQDKPISLQELTPEEQALIKRRYPELMKK